MSKIQSIIRLNFYSDQTFLASESKILFLQGAKGRLQNTSLKISRKLTYLFRGWETPHCKCDTALASSSKSCNRSLRVSTIFHQQSVNIHEVQHPKAEPRLFLDCVQADDFVCYLQRKLPESHRRISQQLIETYKSLTDKFVVSITV